MKTFSRVLLIAAAGAMLAACAKDDGITTASFESIKASVPVPVTFGTYMGETAETRAGASGDISTDAKLQNSSGFGVFAYYTEDKDYPMTKGSTNQSASLEPNFMWNQKVTYSSSAWGYTPVKYWPNDNATADNASATGSSTSSKVSFFAYAPYVADPNTGSETSGIIDISDNSASGNPTVTYKLASDGSNVDLLWGTAGTTSVNINNVAQPEATNGLVQYGATEPYTDGKGKVNINLTKQKIDGSVNFAFKHALAKIGSLKAVADIATSSAISGGTLDATTKITVNSVSISTTGLKDKGTLDLATGVWTLDDTSTAGAFTYNIGQGDIVETIAEPATSPTEWDDLNSVTGVKTTAAELLTNNAKSSKLMVFIPGTTPTLNITINYFVRTKDTNLNIGFSDVEQTITKSVIFGSALELNKSYNLTMHLGLTGVTFTATVSNWDDATGTTDVNLPINVTTTPTP